MSTPAAATRNYLAELLDAGVLIPSGVRGVYGLSGAFEGVIERFEAFVTRTAAPSNPEVMRFPPLLSRDTYERSGHLETFPNLLGSIHGFDGDESRHLELASRRERGEEWASALAPSDLMLVPAACYPLFPTASGVLPPGGRTVDLRTWVFRREPSDDPARMQTFRQREVVRLGTPSEAAEHRDRWLTRGEEMLRSLGLDVKRVVANDPFFGRGGRLMAATQREQELKYELVAPIANESPTAIASANCHLDHFGLAFDIHTAGGEVAHTACIGFGLERITLALFRRHGLQPERWPADVRSILEL